MRYFFICNRISKENDNGLHKPFFCKSYNAKNCILIVFFKWPHFVFHSSRLFATICCNFLSTTKLLSCQIIFSFIQDVPFFRLINSFIFYSGSQSPIRWTQVLNKHSSAPVKLFFAHLIEYRLGIFVSNL